MLVFTSFLVQLESVHAFAIPAVPAVAAVVGALLIACGLQFGDTDALNRAVNSFLESAPVAVVSEIMDLIGDGITNPVKLVFKATTAMIDAVKSWIDSLKGDDDLYYLPGTTTIDGIDISWIPVVSSLTIDGISDALSVSKLNLSYSSSGSDRYLRYKQIPFSSELADYMYKNTYADNRNFVHSFWLCTDFYNKNQLYIVGFDSNMQQLDHYSSSYAAKWIGLALNSLGNYELCMYFQGVSIYEPSGKFDIWELGRSTTFPRTQQEINTTYIPNTGSNALTTEIPITAPADAGTLVDAPAGSTRGDVTTGEGEGTLTIIGLLTLIWDFIQSIPGSIAGAIANLFVPTPGIWDGFISNVIDIVAPPGTVNFNQYVDSIAIPDVTGTVKGNKLTFVDNSMLRDNVSTWRKYIGAFLAVLIIIYNYNMFMKLMGMGTLTLTDSGRVFVPNGVAPPKGGKE